MNYILLLTGAAYRQTDLMLSNDKNPVVNPLDFFITH
jgi:hypothetical protein